MTEEIDITDVLQGYVEALLWANAYEYGEVTDETPEPEMMEVTDAHLTYELSDFSPEDQAQIEADVHGFIEANAEDFEAYCSAMCARVPTSHVTHGMEQQFGHDFLLTRSGHGAGFWDRGLGELGDRLTEASKPYGDTMVTITETGPVLD